MQTWNAPVQSRIIQTMTAPVQSQRSTPDHTRSSSSRSNTPVFDVGDSQNVDPDVSSAANTTRERKRASTSTVDELYADYLKKEIELMDLKKIKIELEIKLLKRKVAE